MPTIQTALRIPADTLRRIDRVVDGLNLQRGGLTRASRTSVIIALIERTLPDVEVEQAVETLIP
jgi:hypothetical protein